MSDEAKHWLECSCCGRSVLGRGKPWWYEDESEKCECGCTVSVSIDGEHDDSGPVASAIADETCEENAP